jgi:hypothetical protein
MADTTHPAAIEHLPPFITAPGQTDYLMVGVIIFLIVFVLVLGNLYFQLHAVPERMAHRTSKVQMEIVAVLALISLFTHNHLFWIAGLLLAFVHIPDFSTPLYSIADSLAKLSGRPPVDTEIEDPYKPIHDEPAKPEQTAEMRTDAHGGGI